VINASPGDLAPVFDAMLEKALTLCGAEHGSLGTYDGDYFRAVASRGYPAAVLETLKGGFHGFGKSRDAAEEASRTIEAAFRELKAA
jgi:hypothetical protein